MKNIPKLRFSEFEGCGEWEEKKLFQICKINPTNTELPEEFIYIDLESVISGNLILRKKIYSHNAPSRAQRLLKHGDIIYQIVRPYQRNNFFCNFDDKYTYVASTGYAQLRAFDCNYFLYQLIHTDVFVKKVIEKCSGSNYPAINSSDLSEISVILPKLKEQQKVADCLSSLDEIITLQTQKLKNLQQHKKGLMQKIFPREGKTTPDWRFAEFRDSGEWENKTLSAIINVIIPPKKIQTNNYLNNGFFPIIDQSQNYIAGWTNDRDAIIEDKFPLIIFGDHTCIIKIVKKTFAQGADGIKIFKASFELDTIYLYQYLNFNSLKMEEYKRHFSILKNKIIFYPNKKSGEQQKIADCLSSIDEIITLQTQKIENLKQHKKGLMQGLFPSDR